MGVKGIFVDILYCSRPALQSVGLVTQTIVNKRKAKSTFKRTLVFQRIPLQIAEKIAKDYKDPGTEIFSLIRNNTQFL